MTPCAPRHLSLSLRLHVASDRAVGAAAPPGGDCKAPRVRGAPASGAAPAADGARKGPGRWATTAASAAGPDDLLEPACLATWVLHAAGLSRNTKPRKWLIFRGFAWLRGLDLNQRPLGYEGNSEPPHQPRRTDKHRNDSASDADDPPQPTPLRLGSSTGRTQSPVRGPTECLRTGSTLALPGGAARDPGDTCPSLGSKYFCSAPEMLSSWGRTWARAAARCPAVTFARRQPVAPPGPARVRSPSRAAR